MPRIVYEWITGEYNPPQNDSHNSRLQNWERQGGTPSSWRNSTTRLKQCVTFTKSVELRIKLLIGTRKWRQRVKNLLSRPKRPATNHYKSWNIKLQPMGMFGPWVFLWRCGLKSTIQRGKEIFRSGAVDLDQGQFYVTTSPQGTFGSIGDIFGQTDEGGVCYWHVVIRDQGCWWKFL